MGKVVKVEIPQHKVVWHDVPQSYEELETPEYGPSSPKKKSTLIYLVLVHLKEVLDRGPLLAEDLLVEWLPREGEDLTRTHEFTTMLGSVDGTDASGDAY